MRIETFSLINQNESRVFSSEQSQQGSNFSGLLSFLSTPKNSTESIRNKMQKNLEMDQQLFNTADSEQLLELNSESLAAFVELLTQSEEGLQETGQIVDSELTEAINLLVNQSEGTEKPELELLIHELLASLPIEMRSNIEQTLQAFRQEGGLISSSEQSEPENTIALLILLTRSVKNGKNPMDNPSVVKLIEFVNRQLESMNLSEVIPSKEDIQTISKKLGDLLNTFIASHNHGRKTEGDYSRSYLQSVFSRYFVEPNGLRNGLRENQITSMKHQSIVAHSGLAIQDDIQTSLKSDMTTQTIIGTPEIQVPMTKVQQFALFVEQSGKQTINQEQFIKEFENILARSQFGNSKDGMKLLIKLYPEHLGSLRIELLQKDNMLIARIIASSGAAKDVLESQIQSLKQSFLSQNIQVEKIEISQQLQQPERSLQKDSQQNNGQGNRQMNEKNQQEDSEENQSFGFALQEELNVKV